MENNQKKALAAILIILLIAVGGYFGLKYLHERGQLPDAVENALFGDEGQTDTTPNNPDTGNNNNGTNDNDNINDGSGSNTGTNPSETVLQFSVIHNETANQGGYSWINVYGQKQLVRYHTGDYPTVIGRDINTIKVFVKGIGEQVNGSITLRLVTANGTTVGASKTLTIGEIRQQMSDNDGVVVFALNNTVSSATYNWVEFDFSAVTFEGDITGAGTRLEIYWQGSHVSQYGWEDRGISGGWLDGSGGGGLNPAAGFFPNFELWLVS